jgi:hypothetical protein
MQLALEKQRNDREFNLRAEGIAVQSELGKMRIAEQAKSTALKFQRQQKYIERVNELTAGGKMTSEEAGIKAMFEVAPDPSSIAAYIHNKAPKVTWEIDKENPGMQVSSLGERKRIPTQDEWGEPYSDENGNILQKNLNTNQVFVKTKADLAAEVYKKILEGRGGKEAPVNATKPKPSLGVIPLQKAKWYIYHSGGDVGAAMKWAADDGYTIQ